MSETHDKTNGLLTLSLNRDAILSPDLVKAYGSIIDFYLTRVKPLIAASEQLDPNQRLNLSAVVEVRSAFDHVMRAHKIIYNIETEKVGDPKEYCKIHLGKARGHLYRATYDSYDVIAISYNTRITKLLEPVSINDISVVIPDYSEKVIKPWQRASVVLAEAKVEKDVDNTDDQQSRFSLYEQGVELLRQVATLLEEQIDTLAAYQNELQQIESVLASVSQGTINEVIPNAAEKIDVPLVRLKKQIADANLTSDALAELSDINLLVQAAKPRLLANEEEKRRSEGIGKRRYIAGSFIAIVAIITALYPVQIKKLLSDAGHVISSVWHRTQERKQIEQPSQKIKHDKKRERASTTEKES